MNVLSIKTGSIDNAATSATISTTICGSNGYCCNAILNDPQRELFKKDAIDNFSVPDGQLELCSNTSFSIVANMTLAMDGYVVSSDGWYVEWARIQLLDMTSFICPFNVWLDYSMSGSTSTMKTVECFPGLFLGLLMISKYLFIVFFRTYHNKKYNIHNKNYNIYKNPKH